MLLVISLLLLSFSRVISRGNKEEICRNDEHNQGKWIFNSNLHEKSFYCCGQDRLQYFDPTIDISLCKNDSSWSSHHFFFYKGDNNFLSHTGGTGCNCDAVSPKGRKGVNDREKWVWVPDNCVLKPWNAKSFCSLLGNRTLMMVGDSTMQQVATTLTSMITAGKGGCTNQIYFGKSYYLIFPQHEQKKLIDYIFDNDVLPDILIYNAGVHLVDSGDLFSVLENLKKQIQEEIKPKLHKMGKTMKFVWKGISPGHFHCDGYKGPILNYTATMPQSKNDKFRWNLHEKFDEIAKTYTPQLNHTFVDLYPVYLRPDAHPFNDCLHFCIPGPLDLFAILLYNKLQNGEI